MMTDDFVECPQISGKTIQSLRIYKDTGDGTELQIDLTDGTSFSCSFSVKPVVEASVIRAGSGEPEVMLECPIFCTGWIVSVAHG
jgi:hypothetical protein